MEINVSYIIFETILRIIQTLIILDRVILNKGTQR